MRKLSYIIGILDEHWGNRRFTLGMTCSEIVKLLKELKIVNLKATSFWKAFGVNTTALDKDSKSVLYYYNDIERTLAKILKYRKVMAYEWD